jgi:transcriptional regulator with XRE-family HTH domain
MARADLARIGAESRAARVSAGLSLAVVGDAVGLSRSQLSRIERSLAPSATVVQLVRIGAVVGLDVRVRAYPGADPLRDVAQIRLLDRFRRRLSANVTFRTEVPLPIVGDQRAWDGWIDGLSGHTGETRGLAVEAETRIADLQAQSRRLVLKMRDGGADDIVLIAADTRANRSAIAAAQNAVTELFPISARRALTALAAGVHPGGSALVLL